ncbi:unnamed protein product [Brachionus calyciflorus]|uniref:NF-kappa-B-repressing factor n=1 Tax=Brachionus calyciflorus TaxID=104777 RepID=A0A813V167_9BILA|nr:unnamed protein product [Brachionus calyciflorus]
MNNDELHLKYRKHNETEREWQLRKLFIERHIDKYNEDRLLCLAQCFVNIKTMGCRYSHKIMNQINELTHDFEPLIEERINSKFKQNRNTSQPKQEQRPQKPIVTNHQTPKPLAKNQDNSLKQKLISKTYLVNDNEVQFNETPKPKIQILTRKNTTPTTTPQSQPINYKNAVLNSLTGNSIQQSKPVKSVSSTPSVPASTTELAPAASTLPIPFGLSPNTLKENSRNVLLNILKSEPNCQKQNDPLSFLLGSTGQAINLVPKVIDDQKFIRLNKINKLRDVIRSIKIVLDDNFDIIDFFDRMCSENNVIVKYEPRYDSDLYFGELFIESFRLVQESHKKRKKCKYYAYKKAYEILVSPSELAVKLAHNQNFEYELYLLDTSSIEMNASNNKSLNDLNILLKSMILQKENTGDKSNLNDDSKESQIELDDDNEDDDEESKSQSISKKTRIKQNLTSFCLFIPSSNPDDEINSSNLSKFIHDRNSLQILNKSCVKSSSNLEFEIKCKSQSQSKSIKTIISGDCIQSEDESGSNEPSKFKCKCLINGVKIASAHADSKNDSKRLAALKAINYLAKMYPVIKETSYQTNNPNNNLLLTSSKAPELKYIQIAKEELFKPSLLPPTRFETPLISLENCLTSAGLPPQPTFGEKLLKKMGWKGEGHGLGITQQGITNPVEFIDINRTRYGLGFKYHFCDGYDEELSELDCSDRISKMDLNKELSQSDQPKSIHLTKANKLNPRNKLTMNEFIHNIRKLLNDFVGSETQKDLVFDKNLSSEDRKIIHKEANKFGLKTKSEGQGTERFLVVRKKQTSSEFMNSLMQSGGELNKYKIISTGDS